MGRAPIEEVGKKHERYMEQLSAAADGDVDIEVSSFGSSSDWAVACDFASSLRCCIATLRTAAAGNAAKCLHALELGSD